MKRQFHLFHHGVISSPWKTPLAGHVPFSCNTFLWGFGVPSFSPPFQGPQLKIQSLLWVVLPISPRFSSGFPLQVPNLLVCVVCGFPALTFLCKYHALIIQHFSQISWCFNFFSIQLHPTFFVTLCISGVSCIFPGAEPLQQTLL